MTLVPVKVCEIWILSFIFIVPFMKDAKEQDIKDIQNSLAFPCSVQITTQLPTWSRFLMTTLKWNVPSLFIDRRLTCASANRCPGIRLTRAPIKSTPSQSRTYLKVPLIELNDGTNLLFSTTGHVKLVPWYRCASPRNAARGQSDMAPSQIESSFELNCELESSLRVGLTRFVELTVELDSIEFEFRAQFLKLDSTRSQSSRVCFLFSSTRQARRLVS